MRARTARRYSANSSGSVIFTFGALCSASMSALDSRRICSAVICRQTGQRGQGRAAAASERRRRRARQAHRRPLLGRLLETAPSPARLRGRGLLILHASRAGQLVLPGGVGDARRVAAHGTSPLLQPWEQLSSPQAPQWEGAARRPSKQGPSRGLTDANSSARNAGSMCAVPGAARPAGLLPPAVRHCRRSMGCTIQEAWPQDLLLIGDHRRSTVVASRQGAERSAAGTWSRPPSRLARRRAAPPPRSSSWRRRCAGISRWAAQARALHHTGARPLTAPLPPPRLSSPLRCPSPHCPCMQAVAFQHLMALESLPQTGREAREAACRLGAVVMASAAPAPLLSQLVAEYLDSLPPARARFVDISTGT